MVLLCCLLQDEFAAEMAALAAQTAAAQQEQADAESALAGVQRELAAQQAIAADIAALEERYWHDLNEYQLSLQQHISERDGLLQRIDRAGQQLLLLKSTNVLNDTFRWVLYGQQHALLASVSFTRQPCLASTAHCAYEDLPAPRTLHLHLQFSPPVTAPRALRVWHNGSFALSAVCCLWLPGWCRECVKNQPWQLRHALQDLA
jgi:hypothetical protein